jgi:hypothetical protein
MTPYLQDVLVGHVTRVVEAADLDLTTDPSEVSYRSQETLQQLIF